MSTTKKNAKNAPAIPNSTEDTVNKVELCGNVARVAMAKGATIVTIAANNAVSGVTNFISCFAFDNREEVGALCKVGERVTVFGDIKTSKPHPDSALVIRKVVPEIKSRLEAEFTGQTYRSDENKVLLRGEIVGTVYQPAPHIVIVTIRTKNEEGYYVYPHVMFFGKIAQGVASQKKPGDTISVLGSFQPHTYKKERKSKTEARVVAYAFR